MQPFPHKTFLALACVLAAALVSYSAAGLPSALLVQKQEKDKDQGKKDEKKDTGLFTGFRKVSGKIGRAHV